jgi:hypothetical protein
VQRNDIKIGTYYAIRVGAKDAPVQEDPELEQRGASRTRGRSLAVKP